VLRETCVFCILPFTFVSVLQLLSLTLSNEPLRDELFCHLVRQLNGNDNPYSVDRLWQLMLLALSTFPPSEPLENYLEHFLRYGVTSLGFRVVCPHCPANTFGFLPGLCHSDCMTKCRVWLRYIEVHMEVHGLQFRPPPKLKPF
jgi:hypothetical protein